jgi:hypothetical protein
MRDFSGVRSRAGDTVCDRIEVRFTMVALTSKLAGTALLIDAHKHASMHRAEVESSGRCGCFFCFRTFPPSQIKSWIDSNQTALCPSCGVDAVLGSASSHRLDDGFLRKMHLHWFAQRSR